MKSVSFGFTDTPISGVTELTFDRGLVNFGADFSTQSSKPGETILVNLTTPVDRPEKFRFAQSAISNVYSGSGISANVQAQSVRGSNVLVQLTEVLSITDDTDPTYRVDVPMAVHLVLKVPAIEQVTEDHVMTALGRLVSGIYNTGSEANTRLKALIRGSLLPSDL